MGDSKLVQLVTDHLCEAQVEGEQPDIELISDYSDQLAVQGIIRFCIEHEGHTIEDAYEVKISIPNNYPLEPPIARETGGNIPDDYRHKFLMNGNLCLGVPVEVRMLFSQQRTLLGFINALLIPSLFSYSYFRDHGDFPFDDREHDIAGLVDFYHEHFRTDTPTTLRLLKYLADFEFPQDDLCPCGSQRELCFCHGRKVLELWGHLSPDEFATDLIQIILLYTLQTKPLDPIWWTLNNLMPKEWPDLMDMWSEFAKPG